MSYPENLLYTEEHEWLLVEGDVATVGITWHAQDALGDIVFAELPEVGTQIGSGESAGELESVKAVSDVYMPASGEVVEINDALDGAEDALNTDPYGAGWMFKIRLSDASELDGLMNSEAYQAFLDNS
ncbi:MAG: glycine cleavage system protein GcvH [Myxococcota bacterium]|nr:glycine cleavage system protein GcvH [Myxococcota bacterium]